MNTEKQKYNFDDIIKVGDAAKIADCGERAIRTALDEGAIKGRNLGGSSGWRLTYGALMEWINGGKDVESA